jgi:lysophospholipase L1-like esterase
LLGLILAMSAASRVLHGAEPAADVKLPKVVLLGDSIRLSYTATVKKQLAGKANVVSPPQNGGDSANLSKHLDKWAVQEQPVVVHFNCGIHDVKKSKATGKFQVSPEQYEANLRAIVKRLREGTKATVLFALTTPLVDDRAAKLRADRDYELLNASTEQYNEIARRVMQELDVPVNDLRAALGGPEEQAKAIVDDGVHFTGPGAAKLGTAVAEFIGRYLPKSSETGK